MRNDKYECSNSKYDLKSKDYYEDDDEKIIPKPLTEAQKEIRKKLRERHQQLFKKIKNLTMEYPNYTGRGNHNIHQLETLCEQFQEYIHQQQTKQEFKIPKLGVYVTSDGENWSGRSNTCEVKISTLQEAVNWIKYWIEDPTEIAWSIIDADSKVIYLSDLEYKESRIEHAKIIFDVDITDIRIDFPEF